MMPASPIPLLIVDDDPVFAAFVRQLVISLGEALPCQPEWADSAEAALAKLRGQAYELVLLDYQLPAADGLSVLDQIQNLPPGRQPAVVMLTGSGNEAVAVEAMKRGARDYLAKGDLDVPPLTRALTSALRQKRLFDSARRRLDDPLPVLLDELLDEVRAFAGGAEFTDDVCLLGIEVARVGSGTALCDRGMPSVSTRPVP